MQEFPGVSSDHQVPVASRVMADCQFERGLLPGGDVCHAAENAGGDFIERMGDENILAPQLPVAEAGFHLDAAVGNGPAGCQLMDVFLQRHGRSWNGNLVHLGLGELALRDGAWCPT